MFDPTAPSRRELILQAIVAALQAADGPPGLTVHRYRTRPLDEDQLPAIVVYAFDEEIEQADGPEGYVSRRYFMARCECRVSGEPPDQQLDPLVTWVPFALRRDETLAELTNKVVEQGIQWDAAEVDQTYAAAPVDMLIDYGTLADDPTEGA